MDGFSFLHKYYVHIRCWFQFWPKNTRSIEWGICCNIRFGQHKRQFQWKGKTKEEIRFAQVISTWTPQIRTFYEVLNTICHIKASSINFTSTRLRHGYTLAVTTISALSNSIWSVDWLHFHGSSVIFSLLNYIDLLFSLKP